MNEKCVCRAAAFIFGVAVGAAVGVLFAPAKGETTRRKLKRMAGDVLEEGREEFFEHARDMKERVKERAGELKNKAAKAKTAVAEKAGELKERIGEKAAELKQRAAEKTEGLRGKAADKLEDAAEKIR